MPDDDDDYSVDEIFRSSKTSSFSVAILCCGRGGGTLTVCGFVFSVSVFLPIFYGWSRVSFSILQFDLALVVMGWLWIRKTNPKRSPAAILFSRSDSHHRAGAILKFIRNCWLDRRVPMGIGFYFFFLLLFSAELRLWAHQVGGKRKVCVHFPAVFHRDRKLSGRQWLPPGNGQLRRFSFFFFHYLPPHSTAPYSAAGGSSVKPV